MCMYDYDSNIIWSHPIKSRESPDLIIGINACYKVLEDANITPIIHRLDNEISDDIICMIKKKDLNHQIATSHDHRQLPVECAIGTWENHMTSNLHGADKYFPAHLWCCTIDQVNIQVNLLRNSRINPRRSAYAELFCQYDSNACPLAPIGTEVIIFQPQTNQTTSYSDHGKYGWYVGPCLKKIRNYQVYVTATKGTQESNRVDFFPTKSRLPNTEPIDRLSAALEDLNHECTPTNAIHPVVDLQHGTDLNKAIKRMKELFQPAITTATNLISNLSAPPITLNLVPRVAGTLFPRVEKVQVHRNSTSIRQPGVNEATNRYAIGTNIRKNFDGTFYRGKIASDNGKWYKIKHNDGDEEELTHR